jgi:hypothetical protein
MDMQNNIPVQEVSFKDFLFKNRRNKTILWLAAAAIVIQFAIFKYLYPFASFIHGDSFSYIKAAAANSDISTYPIGYSRFLRLFSVFTKSDTALVAFQYLFIQASALFLLFTTFYFYKPGRVTQYILLVFMVLNPLFLHLANLVSSDCLFVCLSLIWFSLLCWIIHRPSTKIIIWHALILFTAFIVRYNAIVYPLIATVAFAISNLSLHRKLIGAFAGFLLCGVFVFFTSYEYKKLTGYWQFSPFSGWLIANNAMYAYRNVDSNQRKPVPHKFQLLDNMIRERIDTTRNNKKYTVELRMSNTAYMWSRSLPLYKYRENIFKKDTSAKEFKKWASMGPFFKEYGTFIIKLYPWHFIKYVIWPNAKKYYAPPVEFLHDYNFGTDNVSEDAKQWFNYKSTKVKTRMKNTKVWVLDFHPILSGIINLIMLCLLLFYIALKGWRYNNIFAKGILIGGIMWLTNAGFTIIVSPAALRFQSFPFSLTIILAIILLEWLIKHMQNINQNAKELEEEIAEIDVISEAIA